MSDDGSLVPGFSWEKSFLINLEIQLFSILKQSWVCRTKNPKSLSIKSFECGYSIVFICRVILLCEIEKRQLCLNALKISSSLFLLILGCHLVGMNSNRFSLKQFLSLLSLITYQQFLSKLEAAYWAYCGHDQYNLISFWHVPVLFRNHIQNSTMRDFSVVNWDISQC